jgi:NitT/TauT family transport system substrate-binding protein
MNTRRTSWYGTRATVLLTCLLLVVTACGDGADEESTETTSASTETTSAPTETTSASTETTSAESEDVFGAPETTTIRVANSSTDAGSNAPFTIGIEDGTFAEEGLEVQVGLVDDPRAPLVGGSADVAVIEVPYLTEAVVEGLDLVIISGYRCREQYAFAAQPEIESVEDLAGQNVNMNGAIGDPVVEFRLDLLAEAGWDLRSVPDINYVTIPGSSSAWLEVFKEDQIAMTPFFRSQTQSYLDEDANIILNQFIEWPNEVLAVQREFVEQNPNTVGRFLRALMQTTEFFMDIGNRDAVIAMSVAQDYGTERLEGDYMSGPILHCPNYYVNAEVVDRQLAVQSVEGAPPFEEMSVLDPLLKAQESLGMDNEPTTPPSTDS